MVVKIVKIPYDICHIIKMLMDILFQIPYNKSGIFTYLLFKSQKDEE